MQLKDKVAVVTGAASGIGEAIALALGQEGAAIVIDYRSRPQEADVVVARIKSGGGRAAAVPADVTVPEDVQGLIQKAVQEFGRLDIMVNNAGVEQRMPFL